jgi:hypothetical protein
MRANQSAYSDDDVHLSREAMEDREKGGGGYEPGGWSKESLAIVGPPVEQPVVAYNDHTTSDGKHMFLRRERLRKSP